jgi:cyclophilin family peptidyl-prolyl cis-trans isomerase/predicted DsbA family dithiol-disulfide isomerase
MYGDFQCTLCLGVARDLALLREKYAADVKLSFRHFPQSGNDKAMIAALATESAAAQDPAKFWDMHDQLYAHQSEWSPMTADQFRAKLTDYARVVGLDVDRFTSDLATAKHLPLLTQSLKDAEVLGLKGTPAMLFNGVPYSGRIDYYGLDRYIQLRLLEKRWFKAPPNYQINIRKKYRAVLKTAKGEVEIDLFADLAPVTVNNFVALVRSGWYDGITFHLVSPGQLVQTGDPSGSGFGGPGYTIPDEANNGLRFDREGLVAMASLRGEPNSGGSQFFIALAPLRPASDYDQQFAIFGVVTRGIEILKGFPARNPYDDARNPNLPPGETLLSVTLFEE